MLEECGLLNLVIDGSCKGFRDIDGCTQLFVNENIILYTYEQIIKGKLYEMMDWVSQNEGKMIENRFDRMYLVTIIRFLFYFRIFFPHEEIASLVKFLTSIRTDNGSISQVIYLTINGFILLKHGDFTFYRNFKYYFRGENAKQIAVDVFNVIYQGTQKEQAIQENLSKMFNNISKALG